ncbi:glutamine and serine-rich protein 1 [Astyanax mexicanus]|uniref:glutamine and serine-rich protein 1 n=1 Tax=Astyanax mexicanus TaxID=7994 RepID=UPI0020CAB32D|nr:glutamine and serine-rich protein 1 [Astyanax mexicanus]
MSACFATLSRGKRTMDRSYPSPGFGEPLAAAGQSPGWAYERPAAGLTTSSSYGATHLEAELLHRQTYASTHSLPTYTTSHHPTGLSGVFDTSSTSESSIMNFLSSIESRGLQAGPAATSLLPQFRTPPWQTGTNSSTELFLTGALPSSGTFPTPSALSSFQHPSVFTTRNFTTTSALTVQDGTFSPSNGLLSPTDPLLQIKSPQSTVPTALAFDRLGGASLAAGLPPQSSTYRSAQESAPHLLQPQFSLLPSALGNSQQASSQPYGAPVFSGSIERALQRECSVIKHHQRPSSTQPAQDPLPGSVQHSLQGYLPEDDDVSYQQEPSRHTPVPSSPAGDPNQVVNGNAQQEPASSTVPSPGFSSTSGAKAKDGSSKITEHPDEGTAPHAQEASSAQKQGSVIASQSQSYTSAQLPSLMSISPSQTYITSQSLLSNLSQTQVFSPSQPEKLPSIYKPLPSFVSQPENETPISQSLIYSSSQQQVLSSAASREEYEAQVQGLCMSNPSQSYSSSHSQDLPTASYYAQGPATASASQSYTSGQSLNSSPHFSSSRVLSLPTTNSTQDYIQMHSSAGGGKTDGLLLQQSPKYILSVHSPSSSNATYTQTLPNSQSSLEPKQAYGKRKQDEVSCGELPIEDVHALQQATLGTSTQAATNSDIGVNNNVVYVVSKTEDRHNMQSVIRSNSRSEDQMVGITQMTQMSQVSQMSSSKDERLSASGGHAQLVGSSAYTHITSVPKSSAALMQSSHVALSTDQLKQHTLLLKAPTVQQENHQTQSNQIQPPDHRTVSQDQTQFVRIPSAQVLLEPTQMILLQQPLLHTAHGQSKQMQVQMPVQYLQMNSELVNCSNSGTARGNQQQNHQTKSAESESVESVKQHLVPKDNFSGSSNPHDVKQHFTLNSICFPESMLMADERNILSNVDDILAATAAACGVTPQDFKSTASEGDLQSISNPADSKCHFQLPDNRHGANNFLPQNMIIASAPTMTVTLNGAQLAPNLHKTVDGHQAFALANAHLHQDSSKHEISEKVSNCQENNEDSSLSSSAESANTTSHNHSDFHLAGQEYNPSGLLKTDNLSEKQNQLKELKTIKMEDGLMECSSDGLPKKKVKSKGSSKQTVEDEIGQPKAQKRTNQAKRQNSRGSETGSSSTSEGYDSYQQQERMRQKIREVEEKQPEVKTGFIGSFLDFLKSGPKQHFSSPPIRSPNRIRKPSVSKRLSNNPLCVPPKLLPQPTQLVSPDIHTGSSTKRLEEDLQKNLETLPSFSSDEDESVGKNQDLQKSISSALSSLDEISDKKQKTDNTSSGAEATKQEQPLNSQPTDLKPEDQQKPVLKEVSAEELVKNVPPDKLAVLLSSVAIEGLTDDELSDSEGEGMYRERDEFVVKNEEIESLKITLKAGVEPPAIWKVQKALLQKFIPELRDGKRVFSATNSYLGYFGDAKAMYRRVYVKFLDTVNKREYVRVCSRKPRCKPMHSMRGCQMKALLAHSAAAAPAVSDSSTPKPGTKQSLSKPRPKQPKPKAEPPPKKRKKWKEEFSAPLPACSPGAGSEDDEFTPPVPFASRFLNTRTMKETFRSFVELLISVALDADVMIALEKENDELLLPHMKRVDGMITDNRRRLLPKLHMGQGFKNALDIFPELSVVTELKTDGETPTFKVRLSGKAYNKKTMKPSKSPIKLPLEYTVEQQKTQWFSLYHSLQHYKYHTYLMCMEEIALLRSRGVDLGQEETVQKCMGNRAWLEGLFDRFGELLTQVQQACL